jgi:hypothetical protein
VPDYTVIKPASRASDITDELVQYPGPANSLVLQSKETFHDEQCCFNHAIQPTVLHTSTQRQNPNKYCC